MARGKDYAYEELRLRLLGGHYSPGTQLKEEHLAREFGLSRTPVRAALHQLIADGLATSGDGQGVRVAEWTTDDVDETFQVRMLLEPYVARLAVERGGPGLAIALRACNEQMSRHIHASTADAMAAVQDANQRFHRVLIDACQSARLRTMMHGIVSNPIVIRGFYLYSPEELAQSLHHHQDLTLAAEAGDGQLASEIMHLHIHTAYRRFARRRAELMQTRDWPQADA